jgi:multiple antibiotic resistance protein
LNITDIETNKEGRMDLTLSITWSEYLQKVIGAFAIVNPFSTIPVFISLTAHYSAYERKRVAYGTATSVFIILLVAYFIGGVLLNFFSISVASFRVAGGILILMTAFSMLQGRLSETKQTADEASEAEEKEHIAVIPLALPLLAGPGSISLVIIASGNAQTTMDGIASVVALLVIALLTWLILNAGVKIAEKLGTTGMKIMTRLMGLILAAIAIEFIIAGLGEKFPGWLAGG